MRKILGSSQQLQHINLSERAYTTLRSDAFTFLGTDKIGTLINTIVLNYYELSPANITAYVNREKEVISEIIKDNKALRSLRETDKNAIILSFSEHYRSNLINDLPTHEGGRQFKIRLNNELFRLLYGDDGNGIIDWSCDGFYKSQGRFIKAILEDYSLKSYCEREYIFFQSTIQYLNNAISAPENTIIKITIRTASGALRQFFVKPYKIQADNAGNYNYLIALSTDLEKSEWRPAPFRISRIVKYQAHASYGSGKISLKDKKLLDARLSQMNIQYFLEDEETIKVRLTEKGIKKYNQILNLRPQYIGTPLFDEQTQCTDYEFNCSRLQALNYFIRFGSDAVILSPIDLARQMKEMYAEALEKYQSTLECIPRASNDY